MRIIGWVAAATTATVCGCASIDRNATFNDEFDVQKVSRIDSAARARGVSIYWVNYPQRKPTPGPVVPALGEPSGT